MCGEIGEGGVGGEDDGELITGSVLILRPGQEADEEMGGKLELMVMTGGLDRLLAWE